MSRRRPKRQQTRREAKPQPALAVPVAGARGAGWTVPGIVLIVLAVVVVYIPAMKGGFVWDDDDYVTGNVHLLTLSGLGRIWFQPGATSQYYPLVYTSFWIEHKFWGFDAHGYHVVNVLLHALGAVLLWFVLRRLSVPGAWLAAAVFALHPVEVMSVAWITERKNVLSAVFYFAALLAYLRFDRLDGDRPAGRWSWRLYGLALGLFCCALLSKTVTVSLPAVLLLVTWWKRSRVGLREVLPLVPWFVLGAVAGLTTAWMEMYNLAGTGAGAVGAEWSLPPLERCLLAGRVLWFYFGKLLWPVGLIFVYPRWQVDAGLWWQFLYLPAALIVLVVLWRLRRRLGKAPLVAALFFGGTLFPALGFFNVYMMRYSYVSDHWQYLAGIGPITLMAAMLTVALGLARTPSHEPGRRPALPGAAAALIPGGLLVVLAVLTWRQGRIYQDVETLWRDTLAKNPTAWLAHNNLGSLLNDQGKVDQAMEHFRQALKLDPAAVEAQTSLALALVRQGRLDEAIAGFQKALQLKPGYPGALRGLALVRAAQGRHEEAVEYYSRALRLQSRFAPTHYNLGKSLYKLGRIDEAIAHYNRALELNPDFAAAHNQVGLALRRKGRID